MDNELKQQLEAYIRGQLPQHEITSLEQRIAEDILVANEYADMKRNFEVMDALVADDLKNKMNHWNESRPSQTKVVTMKRLRILSGIAASVVLLIGAFFLIEPSTDQDILETFYKPNFNQLRSESTNDPYEDVRIVLSEQRTEMYEHVAGALAEVSDTSIQFSRAQYYMAHIRFRQSRYQESASLFESIKPTDQYLRQQSDWYRCLSLIQGKQVNEAIKLLEQIVHDSSHLHQKQAQELLKSIR